MNTFKRVFKLFSFLTFLVLCGISLSAKEVDWKKVRALKDMAFVEYVYSLDLEGQAAITSGKKSPSAAPIGKSIRFFAKKRLPYI